MSGKLAVILASVLLALNVVFLKYNLAYFSISQLMFLRFFFATLVFYILFYKRLTWTGIKSSIYVSGFSALSFVFLMQGLKISQASHVQLLLTLTPVFTAFISSGYLKEKISFIQIVGLAMSFSAIIYLVFQKDKSLIFDDPSVLGMGLIVIASLLTSFQIIYSRKQRFVSTAYELAFATMLGNLIVFSIYALTTTHTFVFSTPIFAYLALLYLVLGGTIAAFVLYQYGISNTTAFFAGLSQYIQFPIALIFDILILRESISFIFIVCCCIVAVGTYLASKPQVNPL